MEFISEYRATHVAPSIKSFVYEVPGIPKEDGALFVMPAGRRDGPYSTLLNDIDWQALYRDLDGYLLFEDLKAQWEALDKPDYVLIDSRTGHTDVGGICTRHLPDAVVAFFFPNEQNLKGLEKVVADIRSEAKPPRSKDITTHFVMSNVPDIDDEDQILAKRMRDFQKALRYEDLTIIHRYDSLALLNQSIFTLERPNSRLAREYNALVKTITLRNDADRDAAIELLRNLMQPSPAPRRRDQPKALQERLSRMQQAFSRDHEILFRLAFFKMRERLFEEASLLLNDVVELGAHTAEVFLLRAQCRSMINDLDGATLDILLALKLKDATPVDVTRAIRLLSEVRASELPTAINAPAVRGLEFDDKLGLAEALETSSEGMDACVSLIRDSLAQLPSDDPRIPAATNHLAVSLIGLGRFAEAKAALAEVIGSPRYDVRRLFNLAIAEWGERGSVDVSRFEDVVRVDTQEDQPNYSQCLALTLYLTGRVDEAKARLEESRVQLMRRPVPTFSGWRYRIASPPDFLADLEDMARMFEGEAVAPPVIASAHQPGHNPASLTRES